MTNKPTPRKLNIGSGEFPKEGYVNVDFYSNTPPDVTHNLDQFPYPFEDNSFDLLEADHVLEHLQHVFGVMHELHRVSNTGGIVRIRVPHFSRGFTHADHKRGFDVTFPYYFNPKFAPGYQNFEFKLVKIRLIWFSQPYMKRSVMPPTLLFFGQILGSVIDFFANLSPWACSRIWCFWVGGFEEIEYVFRTVK